MQMSKLAFAGLTLLAAPAYGQGQSPIVVEGGVPTAIVSYADLNIGSQRGLETLNGRIARAASKLCVEAGRKDIATQLAEAHCFNTAMTNAKADVDRVVADQALRFASRGSIKVTAR
jgi:UrcA family protein